MAQGGAVQRFYLDGGNQTRWVEAENAHDIFFRDISNEYRSQRGISTTALVTNVLANDIDEYSLSGEMLGDFHNSNGLSGIAMPSQLTAATNNHILVAGGDNPAGIYRYNIIGTQTAFYDVAANVHGVHELQNGKLLWTSTDGVFSLDPNTGISETIVDGGEWHYIESVMVQEPGVRELLIFSSIVLAVRMRSRS